jgi:hypothetical protein
MHAPSNPTIGFQCCTVQVCMAVADPPDAAAAADSQRKSISCERTFRPCAHAVIAPLPDSIRFDSIDRNFPDRLGGFAVSLSESPPV